MQSAYAARAVDVAFDDSNLIADAGLVPVVALAEPVGLPKLPRTPKQGCRQPRSRPSPRPPSSR